MEQAMADLWTAALLATAMLACGGFSAWFARTGLGIRLQELLGFADEPEWMK